MSLADPLMSPAPTTTHLLRDATTGDDSAWRQLLGRFEPAITATVARFRLQDADARDVTQQTWLQLLDHSGQIREPEALGAWLRTTARRECLRVLRDRGTTDQLPPDDVIACADPVCDVEQRVVDAEASGQMVHLLAELPVRPRTLLRYLFSDDPPGYAELSRRTGIPVGSIGPTRARALQKLRGMIEAELSRQGRPDVPRDLLTTALA
jgi:RNA polymerase sigma factor (sigma-70 family)